MKIKLPFLLLSTVFFSASSGQRTINQSLKEELGRILAIDQGIRECIEGQPDEARKDSLSRLLEIPKDSLDHKTYIWNRMSGIDEANIAKIDKIIARYGYPGKSLVGEPENTAAFFVIQHSSKIDQYFPLIEKAAKNKELPFQYYAMMLDRKLAYAGKEQLYGTQVFSKLITDAKTGEKKMFEYVVPIKDAKNVNKRRKEAGFELTVEKNALRLGTTYKAYTYEELKKIFDQ